MRTLRRRKWLNPISSNNTGLVQYKVIKDKDGGVDSNFAVQDCSRKITLDFYTYTPKDVKEALVKVDILYESIKEFREALYKANSREIEDATNSKK